MRGSLRGRITRAVIVAAGSGAIACALVTLGMALVDGGDIRRLLPVMATAVGAACVLAWPFAAAFARRAAAPLEQLAAVSASFSAGDRLRRAEVRGPREVRVIADSFNRMADDVSSAMEELTSEERRKTQFVSDVSHELRTPLTAIRGAAETLLDGGVAAEDQERFLSTIATEASRLTRLANDLLQLQRIEGATGELPFRRVDVADVVQRAVTMLEPLLEDRGVAVEVIGTAPHVLGDADRLQQVIANIIDNGSRMVGDGGHIWVRIAAENGNSVIEIKDDGPGIPDADIERLFDRFYRSDTARTRSRGGAGLGLAIVRAIVTSHGGTIGAANRPEGGTCFTVSLPALPE